jgi:hypothetical protein
MTEAELLCTDDVSVEPEECRCLMVTAFCPVCRTQLFEYLGAALADAMALHFNTSHPARGHKC